MDFYLVTFEDEPGQWTLSMVVWSEGDTKAIADAKEMLRAKGNVDGSPFSTLCRRSVATATKIFAGQVVSDLRGAFNMTPVTAKAFADLGNAILSVA